MKKFFLTFIAVLALSSGVMAQQSNGPRRGGQRMDPTEMINRRVQQMAERYNLTEEQKTAVMALNQKYFTQQGQRQNADSVRAQRPQNDSVRAERPRRSQGEARQGGNRQQGWGRQGGNGFGRNMEAYNEELKAILTPEQYAAYEKDQQEMRNRMGGRQGGQRMRQ